MGEAGEGIILDGIEQLIAAATAARAAEEEKGRAFGAIVRRYQDMAFAVAVSALGDFHAAEDAAQEAFVVAWRCLDQLREPRAFPGWLKRIVLSQCARVTRGRRVAQVPLDAALLEQAWQRIVDRHPMLRTSFLLEGPDGGQQRVHRHARLPWHVEDWRELAPDEQDRRFEAHVTADRHRDFDLQVPPLLRLALFRCAERRWRLLLTYHHAALDGRSEGIVLREALDLYDALAARRAADLPASPRPYREFIAWLGERLPGLGGKFRAAIIGRKNAVLIQTRLAFACAFGQRPLLRPAFFEHRPAEPRDVEIAPTRALAVLVPDGLRARLRITQVVVEQMRLVRIQPRLQRLCELHADLPIVARLARRRHGGAHARDAALAVGDGAQLLAPGAGG